MKAFLIYTKIQQWLLDSFQSAVFFAVLVTSKELLLGFFQGKEGKP